MSDALIGGLIAAFAALGAVWLQERSRIVSARQLLLRRLRHDIEVTLRALVTFVKDNGPLRHQDGTYVPLGSLERLRSLESADVDLSHLSRRLRLELFEVEEEIWRLNGDASAFGGDSWSRDLTPQVAQRNEEAKRLRDRLLTLGDEITALLGEPIERSPRRVLKPSAPIGQLKRKH